MKTAPWALAALLAVGFAGTVAVQGPAAAAEHGPDAPAHGHEAPARSHDAPAPAARATPWPVGRRNAVANEMRALTGAIDVATRAIANNDLAAIPPALHAVHEARGRTEQAIRTGAYKPPRNGARMADFVARDEAFHDELVRLLRASRAGDLPAASRQMGAIMNGCAGCHQQFR